MARTTPTCRRHLAEARGRARARRVQVARRARGARGATARRRRHRVDRQPRRGDRVGGAARRACARSSSSRRSASAAKVALIEAQGAELRRDGADMDEAKAAARALRARDGRVLLRGRRRARAVRRATQAIGDELLDELPEPPARSSCRSGTVRSRSASSARSPQRAPDAERIAVSAAEAPAMCGELARGPPGGLATAARRSPTASPSGSRSRSPSSELNPLVAALRARRGGGSSRPRSAPTRSAGSGSRARPPRRWRSRAASDLPRPARAHRHRPQHRRRVYRPDSHPRT